MGTRRCERCRMDIRIRNYTVGSSICNPCKSINLDLGKKQLERDENEKGNLREINKPGSYSIIRKKEKKEKSYYLLFVITILWHQGFWNWEFILMEDDYESWKITEGRDLSYV